MVCTCRIKSTESSDPINALKSTDTMMLMSVDFTDNLTLREEGKRIQWVIFRLFPPIS